MIWDASDANPMHRRIPAEVVSRRARPQPRKGPTEQEKVNEDIVVDLKSAIAIKPEQRAKWLSKAFKVVAEGGASSLDLYNVCVSRKFASGLSERIARKLVGVIRESSDVFSDKQQRYLDSNECPLMACASQREAAEAPAQDAEAEAAAAASAAAAADAAAMAAADAADAAVAAAEARRASAFSRQSLAASEPAGKATDGSWQVAMDDAALRRQAAQREENARREAEKREEKRRKQDAEDAAQRRKEEEEAEAQRRRLEEEADSIFMRAIESKPQMETKIEKRGRRSRSASRSRSISSRTARRNTRKMEKERQPNRGESWVRQPPGGVLSGSRAIFMNRDFMEDLPHMPRPSAPGTIGVGPTRALQLEDRSRERSRERSRSRERDRRRRR